nr:hypothetical protein [Bacteroidales bacterium]
DIHLNPEETLSKRQLNINLRNDPDIEILKNKRAGVFDIHKIGEVFSYNPLLFKQKVMKTYVKPFEVVFLLDYSGSMSRISIFLQKQITKILCKYFEENNVDISIYAHTSFTKDYLGHWVQADKIKGDDSHDSCALYEIRSPDETRHYPFFSNEDEGIYQRENYDGHALEALHKILQQRNRSKSIMYISISDGSPEGVGYGGKGAFLYLKKAVEKLKREGFPTIGFLIDYCHEAELYDYNLKLSTKNIDINFHNVSRLINKVIKENFIIN